MARRTELRDVLDAEIGRWSSKSYEQLRDELRDEQAHEIDFESKEYQVEVQILEKTDTYLHVLISVMDGSLRSFIFPLSGSFICRKEVHS